MKLSLLLLFVLPLLASSKKQKASTPSQDETPSGFLQMIPEYLFSFFSLLGDLQKAKNFSAESCELYNERTCSTESELSVCVGSRGNGFQMPVHLTGYARITEEIGPISAAAGASSGSITVFYLESVHMNPLIKQCGASCCDPDTQKARLSFLLKANETLLRFMFSFEIVILIASEAKTVGMAVGDFVQVLEDEGVVSLDSAAALIELAFVLLDPKRFVTGLFSPEYVKMILNDLLTLNFDALVPHLSLFSIYGNIDFFDLNLFIRPGPIDTTSRNQFDYLASFLAGYEPADLNGFETLLETCATPEIVFGNRWQSIKEQPFSGNVSCEDKLADLFLRFYSERNISSKRRLDDDIGKTLKATVSTALFTGDTYDSWKESNDQYKVDPNGANLTDTDFEDIRIGYFGDEESLKTIEENLPILYPTDTKTEVFVNAGTRTWDDVIFFSASESGFHNAKTVDDDKKLASIGGWLDSNPAVILDSLGCNAVFSIVPPGGSAGQLKESLIERFGGDPEAVGNATDHALEAQDGALCVDYQPVNTLDIAANAAVTYESDLITNSECLQSNFGVLPYQDIGSGEKNSGCAPLAE